MKEVNQKLQHNISAVHQLLNSEARILERYLKMYNIEHKELSILFSFRDFYNFYVNVYKTTI